MEKLTREERFRILSASLAAKERGEHEEASRLIKKIPLPTHLVAAGKELFGIEYLRAQGYDLSEAETAHGKAWLDR
jgi:hypothetical protein